MKLGVNIAAVVLLVVGLIWTLQGANILPGSFMTGQKLWLYIGIALSVASLVTLVLINSRRAG
jgi:hypothetical protein